MSQIDEIQNHLMEMDKSLKNLTESMKSIFYILEENKKDNYYIPPTNSTGDFDYLKDASGKLKMFNNK